MKGPFPVVLLLVGSGAINRYENLPGSGTADDAPTLIFRAIEQELNLQGVAVYAYDKRSVTPTDSTFIRNHVDRPRWANLSADDLFFDSLAAFDHVRSLKEIDSARIALLGHSEGTVLATRIAESRGSAVHSMTLLGLFTRSWRDLFYYQEVTDSVRIFHLLARTTPGQLTELDLAPFLKEPGWPEKSWPGLLARFDFSQDGMISEQEWRHFYEAEFNQTMKTLENDKLPWPSKEPRKWVKQYLMDAGDYLHRHLKFCSKMTVFQGEIDIQTPYEDALTLRESCATAGTPLAGFQSYPNLGHGFSPRTGLNGWRDTVGPMPPSIAFQIAKATASALKNH